MGYYTKFKLEIVSKNQIDAIIYDLREISGYDFDKITDNVVESSRTWNEGIGIKWYSRNEDMKELSKLYPDILFILDGEGEEAYPDYPGSCDVWRNYYLGGKVHIAERLLFGYLEINDDFSSDFEPFDESKLRD